MMTAQQYEDTRTGDELIVARDLRNAMCRVPVGRRMRVLGKYKGFKLLGEPCECCGVQAEFERVSRFDVSMPERA